MTIAHNTSSNSIYLSWKPPPADTIFGEFLGYRITYWARDVKPENVNEILIRESSVEVSKQWIVNEIKWRTFVHAGSEESRKCFPFMAQSYKSRIQFPQFDGKCPRERVKMFWFPFCDSTKPRIEAKSIQFISVKATERDFLGRKSNCMFRRLLPFNVIAILNPFVAALSVLKNALEKADGNVLSVISSDSPENAFILALTLLFFVSGSTFDIVTSESFQLSCWAVFLSVETINSASIWVFNVFFYRLSELNEWEVCFDSLKLGVVSPVGEHRVANENLNILGF